VGPEWLKSLVTPTNWLNAEILRVRGRHSLHVLILGTENHSGAKELGLERFTPLR
jgi:hypothetical protein